MVGLFIFNVALKEMLNRHLFISNQRRIKSVQDFVRYYLFRPHCRFS